MRDKLTKNPDIILIKCPCGKELILERVGGQYQNEYKGKCECEREWVLSEISELVTEIND